MPIGGSQTFMSTEWTWRLVSEQVGEGLEADATRGRVQSVDTLFCISIWKSIRTCWHAPAAQLFSLKLSASWKRATEREIRFTWVAKTFTKMYNYERLHRVSLGYLSPTKPAYSLHHTQQTNNNNNTHTRIYIYTHILSARALRQRFIEKKFA